MLVKLTGRNKLTLPDELAITFQGTEYFDVSEENGRLVLTPLTSAPADAIRDKLDGLGITESDVADAVAWARQDKGPIAPSS